MTASQLIAAAGGKIERLGTKQVGVSISLNALTAWVEKARKGHPVRSRREQ